jgi:hypothetical protein
MDRAGLAAAAGRGGGGDGTGAVGLGVAATEGAAVRGQVVLLMARPGAERRAKVGSSAAPPAGALPADPLLVLESTVLAPSSGGELTTPVVGAADGALPGVLRLSCCLVAVSLSPAEVVAVGSDAIKCLCSSLCWSWSSAPLSCSWVPLQLEPTARACSCRSVVLVVRVRWPFLRRDRSLRQPGVPWYSCRAQDRTGQPQAVLTSPIINLHTRTCTSNRLVKNMPPGLVLVLYCTCTGIITTHQWMARPSFPPPPPPTHTGRQGSQPCTERAGALF